MSEITRHPDGISTAADDSSPLADFPYPDQIRSSSLFSDWRIRNVKTGRDNARFLSVSSNGYLQLSDLDEPCITALDGSTIAFIDEFYHELRTYKLSGNTWVQVGNSLDLGSIQYPRISKLSATRIAYIDATNDEIRAYDFDGSDWSLTGSGLTVTSASVPFITSMTSTRVCVIDSGLDIIRVYDFNGSTWSKVGSDFSISGASLLSATTLSSTDIAMVDDGLGELSTYRFNGSTWSKVGNSLSIGTLSYPSITSFSSTEVALLVSSTDDLSLYRFDGINWNEYGNSLTIPGIDKSHIVLLNSSTIAVAFTSSTQFNSLKIIDVIDAESWDSYPSTNTSGNSDVISSDVGIFNGSVQCLRIYNSDTGSTGDFSLTPSVVDPIFNTSTSYDVFFECLIGIPDYSGSATINVGFVRDAAYTSFSGDTGKSLLSSEAFYISLNIPTSGNVIVKANAKPSALGSYFLTEKKIASEDRSLFYANEDPGNILMSESSPHFDKSLYIHSNYIKIGILIDSANFIDYFIGGKKVRISKREYITSLKDIGFNIKPVDFAMSLIPFIQASGVSGDEYPLYVGYIFASQVRR